MSRKGPSRRQRQAKTPGVVYFDHRDAASLKQYLNRFGQIEPRQKTKLKEMQQRHLSRAIKRARHLALLPFVGNPQTETGPVKDRKPPLAGGQTDRTEANPAKAAAS